MCNLTNLLFPLKLLSGANHKKEKDMGARNISKKRAWVREIFQKKGHGCEKYFKKKRIEKGIYQNLLQEIRVSDRE